MEKDIKLNQLLTDYNQWLTSLSTSITLIGDDLTQLERLKQENTDMKLLFAFLIECTIHRQDFMVSLHKMLLKRVESLAIEKGPVLLASLWKAHPALKQLIESNHIALDEIRSNYVILLTNRKPFDTTFYAQPFVHQFVN